MALFTFARCASRLLPGAPDAPLHGQVQNQATKRPSATQGERPRPSVLPPRFPHQIIRHGHSGALTGKPGDAYCGSASRLRSDVQRSNPGRLSAYGLPSLSRRSFAYSSPSPSLDDAYCWQEYSMGRRRASMVYLQSPGWLHMGYSTWIPVGIRHAGSLPKGAYPDQNGRYAIALCKVRESFQRLDHPFGSVIIPNGV